MSKELIGKACKFVRSAPKSQFDDKVYVGIVKHVYRGISLKYPKSTGPLAVDMAMVEVGESPTLIHLDLLLITEILEDDE